MTAVVVEDRWQARLDRMRRALPLPLLAASTALAYPTWAGGGWHAAVGAACASAAAILWAFVTVRPAAARPQVVFWAQTALAGVLVWVNPTYGVFAYTGFLFAYGLGRRWRLAGFAATALIVSAALSDGYPSGRAGQTLTYLVVAAVLMALVLNSATIANRLMEQNQERGRMIEELADANRRLAESMAENADLHARLVAQAREAGIVEERRRMAGEIHDTLAQGLTGIITQLEAAEQTRHRDGEWARHIAQARGLARSSLTAARRSVRALRPEQLVEASLADAIGELAAAWSERSGIGAGVETTGTPARSDADTEVVVFRIAQEALSNVAKHSRAASVRLTLSYLDDTLLLDVADDGVGFDPAAPTEGYGLLGMRQRLARVGGTLSVESARGAGTTVNASVPLTGAVR